MPLSPELAAKILERFRARYRERYPYQKLALCFDRREDSPLEYVVLVFDRDSAWYDLFPDEQIAEIHPAHLKPRTSDKTPETVTAADERNGAN